jgi:hypothetical protein
MRGLVDEGSRNAGGRRPQLRGALGGIIDMAEFNLGCDKLRCVLEIFGMKLGPVHVKLYSWSAKPFTADKYICLL